jgi:L-aspartate oxidase
VTPLIRLLPAVTPRWRQEADVVVVGSGAAGIATALTAAGQGLSVLMVSKDVTGGASPLAQGGLAAAIGPGDSPREHAQDTMTAGAGLCDPDTVRALADGSPDAIAWLAARGARLEQRDLRLEGGHSRRRIVHSGDDASGAEVHRALLAALLASPVDVQDWTIALDLIFDSRRACGLLAARIGADGTLDPGLIFARAVVLAAGGLGQAFGTTSNPAGATGDAVAIAARAGAVLRDPEFVQFHPTVLWSEGATGQRPLITEALRGAGATLRNLDGEPVMAGRHPLGDLAPRDIVAAGMFEAMEAAGSPHLWLDATALDSGVLTDGFPTVTAACRKEGIDPVTELIPVAPGAHYSCGGIAADMSGRTSIPGLFAVGEAASTGVHGANRLASNSLVEAVIMGRGASESMASGHMARALPGDRDAEAPSGIAGGLVGVAAPGRDVLASAMSRYAGVVRDASGLRELLRIAAMIDVGRPTGVVSYREIERVNLHAVSVLIAVAALERQESRGCHRRRDTPETWNQARHTLMRWTPDGVRVTLAATSQGDDPPAPARWEGQ